MRLLLAGALPWVLMAQAPPLSFHDIQQRARTSPDQFRTEALLAERHRTLTGSEGFLREGPSLGATIGPRKTLGGLSSTDQTVELELPLFLARGTRNRLEAALGKADPLLRESAAIEAKFQLRQAFLDAWLAERLLKIREADLATVQAWLKAAQARLAAGADPAFQASLVEGEVLKVQLDLQDARSQRMVAWARLQALAEVPSSPVPLKDPEAVELPEAKNLPARYEAGSLRQALQSRLDLERQTLRHQEALSTSRWSLRGSYSKEGDDRIAKFGFAYRFSRPGESQAIHQEAMANLHAVQRELEIALLELDARFQSALDRLQHHVSPATPPDFGAALNAISLRLSEGRERPSEALPIRRQILEAQVANLRRIHASQILFAECQALTSGVNP